MKRFISFILLAMMFITSCGISESSENDDKKAVASAFSDYINAAKNEDNAEYASFYTFYADYNICFAIWKQSTYTFILIG